jgi:hypothetical protein
MFRKGGRIFNAPVLLRGADHENPGAWNFASYRIEERDGAEQIDLKTGKLIPGELKRMTYRREMKNLLRTRFPADPGERVGV